MRLDFLVQFLVLLAVVLDEVSNGTANGNNDLKGAGGVFFNDDISQPGSWEVDVRCVAGYDCVVIRDRNGFYPFGRGLCID